MELSDSDTKRPVLSTIVRIFDPLGLLRPVIAKVKILMQKLWIVNIDWNDALPALENRYRIFWIYFGYFFQPGFR